MRFTPDDTHFEPWSDNSAVAPATISWDFGLEMIFWCACSGGNNLDQFIILSEWLCLCLEIRKLKKSLRQPSSKDITFGPQICQGDLQGSLAGRTSRACVRETKFEVTLVFSGPSGPYLGDVQRLNENCWVSCWNFGWLGPSRWSRR